LFDRNEDNNNKKKETSSTATFHQLKKEFKKDNNKTKTIIARTCSGRIWIFRFYYYCRSPYLDCLEIFQTVAAASSSLFQRETNIKW